MNEGQSRSVFEAVESEKAVVGAILRGDLTFADVGLAQEDFRDLVCREVYAVMGTLAAQGKPCDLVTVADAMPELDTAILVELAQRGMLSPSECGKYVGNIKAAGMRRALCETAKELAGMAANADIDPVQAAEQARMRIDELAKHGPSQESAPLSELVMRLHMWLYEENKGSDAIQTGIASLDRVLGGGIRGSKLCVIGARPSVGKSALGLFIAANAARDGKRVLLVSLEMDDQEITIRLLSRYSGVPGDVIERRELDDMQTDRIIEAYGVVGMPNLSINTRATTPARIRQEALRLRQEGGLDLIVVDYMQLLQSGQRSGGRTEEVGQISRALKLITMELHIPVIVMAQMNRQSEMGTGEGGRAPKLSEFRESGSIEQDANQALILHRPSRDQLGEGRTELYDICKARGWTFLQIRVEKNRGGRTGIVPVAFDAPHMTFIPFTRQFQSAPPDGRIRPRPGDSELNTIRKLSARLESQEERLEGMDLS